MLFAIKPIQQPYDGPFHIQTNVLQYRETITKKLYQLTDLNGHLCDVPALGFDRLIMTTTTQVQRG